MNKIKMNRVNKKGLSEIIAYTLLILIAVSMAGFVYIWLQIQLPKDKMECPDGVSIAINSYSCRDSDGVINITFENKGLFNLDGVNVLISNDTNVPSKPITALSKIGTSVQEDGFVYFNPALPSGREYLEVFNYAQYKTIKQIQVIPFVFSERTGEDSDSNKLIICKNAIITEKITCS